MLRHKRSLFLIIMGSLGSKIEVILGHWNQIGVIEVSDWGQNEVIEVRDWDQYEIIEIGLRSLGSENQVLPGKDYKKVHFFLYVKTNLKIFYNTM